MALKSINPYTNEVIEEFKPLTDEQIEENAGAVIQSIVRARPAACKGVYLKSVTLSSTMGPGIKLDTAQMMSRFK